MKVAKRPHNIIEGFQSGLKVIGEQLFSHKRVGVLVGKLADVLQKLDMNGK